MKNRWERWAPLTGVLSVACSFVGMMTVLNLPQGKDTDAAITAYFTTHAHRVHSVAGFLVALAGVLLLLVFLVLRRRLIAAEGHRERSPRSCSEPASQCGPLGDLSRARTRNHLRHDRDLELSPRPEHVQAARRHRISGLGRRSLHRRAGHLDDLRARVQNPCSSRLVRLAGRPRRRKSTFRLLRFPVPRLVDLDRHHLHPPHTTTDPQDSDRRPTGPLTMEGADTTAPSTSTQPWSAKCSGMSHESGCVRA